MKEKINVNTVLLGIIVLILVIGFFMYWKGSFYPYYEYETKWVKEGLRDGIDDQMGAKGWEVVSTVVANKGGVPGREITYKRKSSKRQH